MDDHYVMLVMELCTGGELYKLVSEGPMEEERARNFMKQIVSALMYCHENGVCHRDLKLENLMLVRPGEDIIKVTDFGLSKDLSQHSQPKTKVGTISYMAPEITQALHSSPYDGASADIWSIGVILYVMVCCAYPFGYDGPKRCARAATRAAAPRAPCLPAAAAWLCCRAVVVVCVVLQPPGSPRCSESRTPGGSANSCRGGTLALQRGRREHARGVQTHPRGHVRGGAAHGLGGMPSLDRRAVDSERAGSCHAGASDGAPMAQYRRVRRRARLACGFRTDDLNLHL